MSDYIILLFHSTDGRDRLSLKNLGNIHPEIFGKLAAGLKNEFDIVSLKELLGSVSGDTGRRERLLAITFDDGPKSYATEAVPVMSAYGIPSTCFLITDCIGDNAIYWRYLYNFCMNRGYDRELAGLISAEYGVPVRAGDLISFTRNNYDKEKNRRVTGNILKQIVPEEEYSITESDLFLSYLDIEELKDNPLVSFGIHTRTHPVMRRLSDEEILDEISGSLDFYKSRINDEIPMFSIPFGRLYKDYDERTIIAARKLSIEYIFSAYGGHNKKGQPPYNIRRISVNEGLLGNGTSSFIRLLGDLSVAPEYFPKEEKLSIALSRQ